MIERLCPLCNSQTAVSLFAEARLDTARMDAYAYASRKVPEYMHHRLLHCAGCDVIYASPVPNSDELASAYAAAAFDSQLESVYASLTYASAIGPVCARLPDRLRALDVGAGDGAFCRQLKALGFANVTGLEPSSAPVEAADPSVKSDIMQAMFTSGMFPAETFSLVTCFQTIEHVSFPKALCEEAVSILKPGGALCIVAHNRRALSARLLGRNSPIFDLEHLQLFSPSSLRQLLESAGLKSVEVKALWNRYPIAYWTRLFPIPMTAKQAVMSALKATRMGSIPVKIPAGNLIAWGFR